MIRSTIARLFGANRHLLVNAGSMVGSMLFTSGFGLAYWLLAARLYDEATVGLAGAGIAAMSLLGTAGMLGLGTLLIGELPRAPDAAPTLLATALAVAGLAGGVLGLLFALLAPTLSANLSPLAHDLPSVALFTAGVSLTAVVMVLDQALIGMLRGTLQLWRNILFATLKLIALAGAGALLARGSWQLIYATWLAGNVLSTAALAGLALRGSWWRHRARLRPQWGLLRHFGRAAVGHHGLNLALQIPGFALPIVATVLLSAAANAYFYTASMLAGFVFFGPLAIATALYAAGAHEPDAVARRMRFTLGIAMAAGLLANLALFVVAEPLLSLFGREYAGQASWTLRVMGLGVFPIIIKDHYVTIARLNRRLGVAALVAITGSGLELGLAAVGAQLGGLTGLAVGWLIGVCLEACAMGISVYRVAFAGRDLAAMGVTQQRQAHQLEEEGATL